LISVNLYTFLTYDVFTADTLRHAVTLTLILWPWTFVLYRLSRNETLANFSASEQSARELLRLHYVQFMCHPLSQI